MKTLPFLILLLTTLASAQERYVRLWLQTPNEDFRFNQLQLSSNEVAEVTFIGTDVLMNHPLYADLQLNVNSVRSALGRGETIVGPANVFVQIRGVSNGGPGAAVAVLKVRPIQSTAGAITAAPLPAGVGARVALEESGDLVTWSAVAPGDFSKTETNRFYRVRMILAQ